MLKEEFKHIKESGIDLRKFGITVGSVLIIIAVFLFYFEKPLAIYFAGIGAILILTGLIYPMILKPVNKVWMGLAIVLGFFMSRLLLTLLFYFVVTPISFIAKIVSKKFMALKYDKSANTYWEKRSVIKKNQ